MTIDDQTLRILIKEVVKQLKKEEAIETMSLPKPKMVAILGTKWQEAYNSFFDQLPQSLSYELTIVLTKELKAHPVFVNTLAERKDVNCVFREDINIENYKEFITVFPVVSREMMVKTALCIHDTFETKWIQHCMEKGQKIIMLKYGMEQLTGKEPKAYQNKIKHYYETLLDYEIEIKEEVFANSNPQEQKQVISYTNNGKKIITEKEVDQYVKKKKIELYKGDIITDLAKEKAKSLGITMIRM
ncbi:hypothetical protein EDC19_2675 [Natranaerovirga hydrolytica]|uniref:Ethanolamine utilization protein n=1 Tax=Natranaerovirga hydrolytica TaxID=680378 RepID=A0A4R1M6X1_9FIRM|nr:hypothetical protein [Natranaerovirga hydrolytica]TCK88028.1 hypothetical protein EDC19_2675 [Natranaerovirga hydrolytica]